jgi:hypothetical protein
MRVLNGPAVAGDAGEDGCPGAVEAYFEKAGMAPQPLDGGSERPDRQAIPRNEPGRRPALLCPHAMVARPEGERDEARGIAEAQPAGEADLEGLACAVMPGAEARRQRRRVVRDDEVAGLEPGRKRRPLEELQVAVGIDGGKALGRPVRTVGGDHAGLATAKA